MVSPLVERVEPPANMTLGLARVDYADAYRTQLSRPVTIEEVGRAFLTQPPSWIRSLMAVRDALAGAVGLRTSAGGRTEEDLRVGARVGPFRLLAVEPRTMVLGENDRHLDFRVSLSLNEHDRPALTVITLVCFHTGFGRLYFTGVKPFHKQIVRSMTAAVARSLA